MKDSACTDKMVYAPLSAATAGREAQDQMEEDRVGSYNDHDVL